MGLLGFLKFAFKLFDLLAWPLFGLGFPLYASIRAIENNPNSDMRNLVAYWIIFSLNSLFELAFVKLIDWLLFWPYMKLMAVCWLVLPDFNGASYIYDYLLRPCLSVDPRAFIKYLIKPNDYKSLIAENFLAEAERYVEENGSEALEKLLERKSKQKKPDIGVEEIKAITNTKEKETAAAIQSKNKEPNVAKEDARAVELPEKNPVATTWSKVEEPNVAKHNANVGEPKGENPAVAAEQVKCVEPNLAQNEKKTFAVGETKEKAVPAAGGENKAGEITDSEKVQRVLTCALCQVRIPCQKNLESHFEGRKHKAIWVKVSKQENESKGSSSSAAIPAEPKNTLSINRPNETRTEKQEDKVHMNWATEQIKEKEVDNTSGGMNQSKLWCSICDVKLLSEIDLASHIGGKKHLKKIQQHLVNTLGGGFY